MSDGEGVPETRICEFVLPPDTKPGFSIRKTPSRRPSSDFDIVNSSVKSMSLPTGTPMAMRVTRGPSGLISRAR